MWLPQCGQLSVCVCVCVCVCVRICKVNTAGCHPLRSTKSTKIFPPFMHWSSSSSPLFSLPPPLTARERREQLFDLSPPLSALAMKKGTSIRSSPLWSSPDRWDQRGFSPFFSVFFLRFDGLWCGAEVACRAWKWLWEQSCVTLSRSEHKSHKHTISDIDYDRPSTIRPIHTWYYHFGWYPDGLI